MASKIVVEDDIFKIKEYISEISDTMSSYIDKNTESEYRLIRKNISHSDLISSGKRTNLSHSFNKNLLYYMTVGEMEEFDKFNKSQLPTAHQSNIMITKSILYDFIGVIDPGNVKEKRINLNDYVPVLLVDDTLKYFNSDYTFKVFEKLNKISGWTKEECNYQLTGDMTRIDLSVAAHGVGCSENVEFQKLRRSIFKSDEIIFLLENDVKNYKKNIYLMFRKNPKFYTIIGESDSSWEKYLRNQDKIKLYSLLKKNNLSDSEVEKTRKNQSRWRKLLAEEMMSYNTDEDKIFCPMTYISGSYSAVGTLFRASHIKAFKECTIEEAFDINNGILISANADALFDKHLITIDDDGNIIYSYLVKNEGPKFITELRLTEKVYNAVLSPERKMYLKRHRDVFEEKEALRKLGMCIEMDSSDQEQL